MKKLNEEELAIFYQLDKKKYKVKGNKTLKSMLEKLGNPYRDEDIQDFINKLIAWYGIKFSDKFILKALSGHLENTDTDIMNIMDMDSLQLGFNTVETEIFSSQTKDMITFKKYLVLMAGCGLIYSKGNNPFYGYYRAEKLFQDCNTFFNWDLSVKVYDPIMEWDYSPSNQKNIQLLAKQKKKKEKKNLTESKKTRILKRVHSLFH